MAEFAASLHPLSPASGAANDSNIDRASSTLLIS